MTESFNFRTEIE
jgi:serine/threonine-protein phosphatase 2B catalytic subunit